MILQLITFLRAISGLGALMNLDFIFPGFTYGSEVPYISITQVSGTFDSDKGNNIVMTAATFQLDIYANTYKAMDDIASTIKAGLDAAASVSGHSFYLEGERDIGEEAEKTFRRSLDIAVEKNSL